MKIKGAYTMKTLENIKAAELNEEEMINAAGGNVVYVDGLYCVYDGNGRPKNCPLIEIKENEDESAD